MNQTWTIAGSILGSNAFTLLLTHFLGRRKNRVDEAKIIADLSAQLRQELFQKYEERGKTITSLRRVIIYLTNFLDKLIPRITGLAEYEMDKFRDAVLEARLAGLAAEI